MKELIVRPLTGEIVSGRDMVRVIARVSLLRLGPIDRLVLPGATVEECLAETLGPLITRPLVVHLSDRAARSTIIIEREQWKKVRPKPGTVLTAHPRLQGGDGLRSGLMLVAAIAAVITATAVAGPGGFALTAGTWAYAGTVAGISGGIILGANLALNALFPTRPTQLDVAGEQFQQLPSIAGARNQAPGIDTPIPEIYGTHLVSPYYGAKYYTEIVGDDQFLRLIFIWGYGPLLIDESTLKIGDTLLSSFGDYEIEHRQGYDSDLPLKLFTNQAFEEPLSIALHSPGDWEVRRTADEIDEIVVDWTAPNGIYYVSKSDSKIMDYYVRLEAEFSLVGSGVWTAMAPAGIGRSVKTARIYTRAAVSRGQYDVRVRKEGPADLQPDALPAHMSSVADTVVWTALRAFRNDDPIGFPKPLAKTALRIKATDQLNGALDTLNGIVTSLVAAFNGTSWIPNQPSSNPADHFRHKLQGPANARPVDNAQIDFASLEAWWAYCVDEGFTYNQVRSSRSSVYDALADIAAAGRAVPRIVDGKWRVVWDRPNDSIVQHFTPRNSWGFSGQRVYPKLPHGWRVRFINAQNGYTDDERIVYDDGYDSNNATLFEAIEFPGVTDPDLIWRHGRFHIAQVRLRPEEFSLSVGWENLACTGADRVRVTHDVLLIGQISGRVKSITGQTITIDETISIESGKTYGFYFRNADVTNRSILRAVDAVMVVGEYAPGSIITLVGDLTVIDANALFGFGETDQETSIYRVKSIAHQKDLIAQLVLVDDAPAISEADQGDIPAYVPNVTLPPDPFTLTPQNLKLIEFIDGFGQNATASVRLSWTIPRRGKVTAFEIQERDDNSSAPVWRTVGSVAYPTTRFDLGLIADGLWSYRVRSLFDDGTTSGWTTLATQNLLGLLTPPDEVSNFRSSYNQSTGRIYLTWDALTDDRGILYEIRKGESWDAALIIGERITQPKFETVGDDTYWIAAYVITPFGQKVFSETKHSLALTGSVLTENVVVSRDERALHWDGYFGGSIGRDDDLNYLRSSGTDNFLAETDVLGLSDFFNHGGQGGGYYRSKVIVDAGREMPCRVSVDFGATAVAADEDFLGQGDFLGNPDIFKSYLTQFIRAYPVIRVGTAADPDAFAPADIFAEDDAFAAGITWGVDWQKWTPDVYVGRFFQLGFVFEILDATVGAIAYGTAFAWVVDVPDRWDRYQNLTVPIGGLPIVFQPEGDEEPAAFKGGINNEPLPHILTDLVDRPTGFAIKVIDLTLSGCTVKVVDVGGIDVGGSGVNVMAQGYG